MSESILKIKYYKNGQFKGSEGVSIFANSNEQSTIQFKFDEDLGDASVLANILVPYPYGSQLYGKHQKQSLIMKKDVDPNGGYIYSGTLTRPYLATDGKAYINAQVYASEGYIESISQSGNNYLDVNGISYLIGSEELVIGSNHYQMLKLTNENTGKAFVEKNFGTIILEEDLICVIKQKTLSWDANDLFNGNLRLTSGVQVNNYQQIEFKITSSAPYYAEYPLTLEESYVLRQAIGVNSSNIANLQSTKQNIDLDPATIQAIEAVLLSGNAPTQVEQSLIDLFTQVQENLRVNNVQTGQIAGLLQTVGLGINIVGTITTTDTLPTDEELNQFVEDAGYPASNSNIIYIKEIITGGTDKFCIATYSAQTESWTITEVQYLENASNSEKGVVKGTANDTSDTSKILFDIQAGVIVDAKAYRNGTWVSIRNYLTTIDQIMSGEVAVPKAMGDGAGNNIENTYMDKANGASKTYVQEYASPKIINDIYYFDFADDSLNADFVNNSNPKTVNINILGDNPIGEFELTLDQDLLIGNKNGMMFSGYLQSVGAIEGRVKNVIYYSKAEELYATEYVLGSELSDPITFGAGVLYKAEVNARFDQLNDPITLSKTDKLIMKVYINTESTYDTTLDFIANTTYKSVAFVDKLSFVKYVLDTNDYDQLQNKPIINDDLSSATITDLPTYTIYRHVGVSDATYLQGMLYFRKPDAIAMTPIWQEWVEGAEFSDGTTITRTGNTLVLPVVTPDLLPFVDLASVTDVTPTSGSTNLAQSGGVADALATKADLTDIAPAYDSTATYSVGDLVTREGNVYQCNTAISTAEAWNSAHWTQKDIKDLLAGKQDKLADGVEDFITSEYNKTLNLWDEQWEVGGINNGTGADDNVGVYIRSKNYIGVKPNATYYIGGHEGSGVYVYYYRSDKSYISFETFYINHTFTTPANCELLRFVDISQNDYTNKIMLVEGSTAHAYVPYNGAIVHEKQLAEQKVKANEITCHQLVMNEYINYSVPYATSKQVTEILNTIGHKYYYKVSNTVNSVDISMTYADSSYERIVLAGNGSYEGIFTANASKTTTNVSIFASNNGAVFSGFNIIDLTTDYGVGQEPSLEECKKIFRVPYGYGENKISVLEDSKKITSFQTPIQTKVVSFNQLVANEYTKSYTYPERSALKISGNTTGGANHKYYIRNISANNDVYVLTMVDTSNNRTDTQYSASIDEIKTFSNVKQFEIYSTTSTLTLSDFIIEDLTAQFGAGQEPTLEQCQALFNAKSYNYTSGKDMQLIYDGEKPIALVEIPEQEPIKIKFSGTTTSSYVEIYRDSRISENSIVVITPYYVSNVTNYMYNVQTLNNGRVYVYVRDYAGNTIADGTEITLNAIIYLE